MRLRTLALVALAASAASCRRSPKPGDAAATTGSAETVAPATIRAAHILVGYRGSKLSDPRVTRTKDEARRLAEELAARAKQEDFGSLAQRFSDDHTNAWRGGDLGTFSRDRMVKAFSDAAFALRPGAVSSVVETEYGFHVIKRIE